MTQPEQRLCRAFGRYIRTVRKARGHTQETLAKAAGLSADTIRRLESYGCSPRVDTLNRLSKGLGMATSSLLEGYENGQRNEARELIDLITSASPKAIRILTKLARLMIAELDGPAVEEPTADVEPAEDDDEDDEP